MRRSYQLSATTQGPLYPPSEVMDAEGNFVVVGQIPNDSGVSWSGAIVAPETPVPEFGEIKPYRIGYSNRTTFGATDEGYHFVHTSSTFAFE